MPGPPTAGFSHWGSSHRQWQTPAAGLGKQQLTARSGVACDGAALTSGGSGGVRPTASGKSQTATQRRPSTTGHNQSRVPQQRPGTVGVRGAVPPPVAKPTRAPVVGVRGAVPPPVAKPPRAPVVGVRGAVPPPVAKPTPAPFVGVRGAVPPPVAKPTPAPFVGVRGVVPPDKYCGPRRSWPEASEQA